MGHKHGRRFIVLGHKYGRHDVMREHTIPLLQEAQLVILRTVPKLSLECNLLVGIISPAFPYINGSEVV